LIHPLQTAIIISLRDFRAATKEKIDRFFSPKRALPERPKEPVSSSAQRTCLERHLRLLLGTSLDSSLKQGSTDVQ
jgi:hypothetical protein